MAKWVVTGISGKNDGILAIVEANSLSEAFNKVASIHGEGLVVKSFVWDGCEYDVLTYDHELSDNEKESMTVNLRHDWLLSGQEVRENVMLDEAVCW